MNGHSPCHSWFLQTIFLLIATVSGAQIPQFETVGASQGLSQGMIFDLIQDRKGFLWVATKDGLNRYDGYSFQVFQNDPFNPFSISDDELLALLEDSHGRIWIGTVNNGLAMLNPSTGRYYHLDQRIGTVVSCIEETPDGAIWVGSEKGLVRLRFPDPLPAEMSDLSGMVQIDYIPRKNAGEEPKTPADRIIDLAVDKQGVLWVSWLFELGKIDPAEGTYHKIWEDPVRSLAGSGDYYLKVGPDGSMWVGQCGRLLRFKDGVVSEYTLPEKSIFPRTDVAFDRNGNMFVSTRKQIYRLPARFMDKPDPSKFQLFYRFPETGIIGTTKITIDRSGILWVGTNGYGLLKYIPGNAHFNHLFPGTSPRRISGDNRGRVWVWLAGGKFYRMDKESNGAVEQLHHGDDFFQHDCLATEDGKIWIFGEDKKTEKPYGRLVCLNEATLQEEFSIPVPIVCGIYSRIYRSSDGNIWMTGLFSGLARFDVRTRQVKIFDLTPVIGYREATIAIFEDSKNNLWLGKPHGLIMATPAAGDTFNYKVYRNNPRDMESLNSNFILSIVSDPLNPDQFLWIGTKGGLNHFNIESGKVRHYTKAEGLPNNVIYSIVPDDKGTLWLGTNCGLSNFAPQTGLFRNYFRVDGIQDNEFNTLSFYKDREGALYFGGVNGVTTFLPQNLTSNLSPPPVYLTGLKINGKSVSVGSGILEKVIEETKQITLKHNQNQITFEFAAIDFASPRMNQFRYRLVGADHEWAEATTERAATYANLSPGKYVFEVITGGSRGAWSGQPARLEVLIRPPWWRTYWAYLAYVLAIGFGALALYRFKLNRINLENQVRFEHNQAIRLAELDRLKTNFVNGITHEFRTPLTLLIEPARQLLSEIDNETHRYKLELIDQNGQRLLQYVNQLLDLSKIEAGQMPLDLRPGNPVEYLSNIIERFEPLASQKGVALTTQLPDTPKWVMYDAGTCEHIITNLISNALKFTDKGGTVHVRLTLENAGDKSVRLIIEVKDSGMGINEKDLPRIFDRFYQTDHDRGGTGLGLAFCKELVEHMGGVISVESKVGEGSKFSVCLVCEKADPVETPKDQTSGHDPIVHTNGFMPINGYDDLSNVEKNGPLILLVEDDLQLRQFLRSSLPTDYRILEASNGNEGLQSAFEFVPDLIVSDVSMPGKDGFSLVEDLRSNTATSHIPVILLTAKANIASRLKGLQRGADAYLTKPFRADELTAHIENLLNASRRIRDYFTRRQPPESVDNEPNPIQLLSEAEQSFLENLTRVLEENLDNDQMDAEAFAKKVFLSRSQLHRKLVALTGLSLTEFVRNFRLEKAREMLLKDNATVMDVAWSTGFPNVKYFSTSFKERYGESPSQFMERMRKE